jgi:hypothetical protein
VTNNWWGAEYPADDQIERATHTMFPESAERGTALRSKMRNIYQEP